MVQIPLEPPKESDIYSYRFDKNLNRTFEPISSGTVYNAIDEALNTEQLLAGGNLTLSKLDLAGLVKTVSVGDDIQEAINALNRTGGGTLQFKIGTYIINRTLRGYSLIKFLGAKQGTTILSFEGLANLFFESTQVYTAGTISNITGGVNVTGSGTLWLTNVTTDHQFFIANRWYAIDSITSDTALVLKEGYVGGATFPGASYRAAKIVKDIDFEELSFKNSTGTALAITDGRNVTIYQCTFQDNNKGFVFTNVSEFVIDNTLCTSNNNNGYELNTSGFGDIEGLASTSNSNHGAVLNNVSTLPIMFSAGNANTGDGFNVTNATDLFLTVETSSNSSQGIELVSGNTRVTFDKCLCSSNTSDGIKLTASSDDCRISNCVIISNGGFGINIVDSTSDRTLISPNNTFSGNTSGTINEQGTNTFYNNGGAGAFSAVNSANNNIDIGEQKFTRITGPTAAFSITGIAGTANAKEVTLFNSTTQNMTIANESISSTFTQRIITGTGLDVSSTGVGVARLVYSAGEKSWILLGLQG